MGNFKNMTEIQTAIESACAVYSVSPAELLGKSKIYPIARARRAAMTLMVQLQVPTKTAAEAFRCCRTNICHAYATVRDDIQASRIDARDFNRARVLAGLDPSAKIERITK